MKRFLISFFVIISIFGGSLQAQEVQQESKEDIVEKSENKISNPQTAFEQAQYEYQENNYHKAIDILEGEIKTLKEKGEVSPELFYNLGNAYFRMNEFPEAILNYERAHLYDPGDRDIRHNIEYTRTKIEDKILTADNFFLKIWFEGVQNLLPSNGWAVLSIIFFIFFIICLFIFFFSSKLALKKAAFYAGIILLVFLVFTNIFSANQKSNIEHQNTAIVMAGSASVVSSPSGTSKDLFILHAGTKVQILKEDGSWYEIEIANGSIGWIKKDMVEII